MRRASERSKQTAKELAALNAWRGAALTLFASPVLLVTLVVAVAIGSRRVTTDATQDLARPGRDHPAIVTDGPCQCQGHP